MYPIHTLAELFPGFDHSLPFPEAGIQHICFDSRKAAWQTDSLFIALKGARADGHIYLKHAHEQGIRSFLVREDAVLPELPGSNIIRVPDVLKAFHKLASFHRSHFKGTVVAVTGSNGKTWVKEWLFSLGIGLADIYRSPGSYNSQVGVPLSVWEIPLSCEYAIIEAGVSMPGEMKALADIIQPDVVIITHLGDAHDEGFEGKTAEKLNEKLLLAVKAHTLVYPGDEVFLADTLLQKFADRNLVSWSLNDHGTLQASREQSGSYTTIRIHTPVEVLYTVPLVGSVHVANILNALTALYALGLDITSLKEEVRALSPIDMRMKAEEAIQGCVLINDSYSLDLDSLSFALESLERSGKHHHKTLILSDHAHSRPGMYEEVASMIKGAGIDTLICIGQEVQQLHERLHGYMEVLVFADVDDFIRKYSLAEFQNEVILLKGARRFGFERIAGLLRKKSHSAVLHVDLSALDHNLRYFYTRIKDGVKKIAVVKANAYGAGSLEICRFLAYQHVDMVAVALIDEGVELREAGLNLPVMVLNPDPDSMHLLFQYHLEPEVYNQNVLDKLISLCQYRQEEIVAHIKLDSGTHRLGFSHDEISGLAKQLEKHPWIKVGTVFTHLSASDDPVYDDFTHEQARRFANMYDHISEALGYSPPRHILSTFGILRFPEYQYEYVRLGIGLYGVGIQYAPELVPVHTLSAKILHIQSIASGESVSYGRSYITDRPRRIATVNLGYADGLPRSAGNTGYAFLLHGKNAPVTGRVCMDMTMIDVSDIPEAAVGDEVQIFGKTHSLDKLAALSQTIPYEILTHLHPRIRKVYEHG